MTDRELKQQRSAAGAVYPQVDDSSLWAVMRVAGADREPQVVSVWETEDAAWTEVDRWHHAEGPGAYRTWTQPVTGQYAPDPV